MWVYVCKYIYVFVCVCNCMCVYVRRRVCVQKSKRLISSSMLQRVAACCSMWQCAAVCCTA